jgi:hypothetical protein
MDLHISHLRIYFLMFGVQAFGLESQHLVSTMFQAQKPTLMAPPRRVS